MFLCVHGVKKLVKNYNYRSRVHCIDVYDDNCILTGQDIELNQQLVNKPGQENFRQFITIFFIVIVKTDF